MKDLYIEDIPKGVSISDYITALEKGYQIKSRVKSLSDTILDGYKPTPKTNPLSPPWTAQKPLISDGLGSLIKKYEDTADLTTAINWNANSREGGVFIPSANQDTIKGE